MTQIIELKGGCGHPANVGDCDQIRWPTLLIVWTAALALPAVAAPAVAAEPPCPMESAGVAVDHQAMGCCEHGKGGGDQPAPCKPGMACFATAAALPPAAVEFGLIPSTA